MGGLVGFGISGYEMEPCSDSSVSAFKKICLATLTSGRQKVQEAGGQSQVIKGDEAPAWKKMITCKQLQL